MKFQRGDCNLFQVPAGWKDFGSKQRVTMATLLFVSIAHFERSFFVMFLARIARYHQRSRETVARNGDIIIIVIVFVSRNIQWYKIQLVAAALSWNVFALTIEKHWTLLIIKTNTAKLLCMLLNDFTSRLTDVDSSPRQDERATIYEAVITFRIGIPTASNLLAIVRKQIHEAIGDLVQDRRRARIGEEGMKFGEVGKRGCPPTWRWASGK
jgi:hypothetical protein